jgi:ubiquinone/menaquinone biosynthesis C-methylase UbiE
MPLASNRIDNLYQDMYANDVERLWRDVGAIDKGANILRAWSRAGFRSRPKVVEIGCGEGAIAEYLAQVEFFESYVGFDLSSSGISSAIKRDVRGARFIQVDGETMPFKSDNADLVIMSHVIEHLEHPRALIYEARRIAPWLIVEVPLELNARSPRDHVWDDLGHINKYTALSIRHLVQTCDLEVVEQMTTNPSRAVALFSDSSEMHKLQWRLKEACLFVSPRLARSMFTYHETLLAQRRVS